MYNLELTKDELKIIESYIDFMAEFDDDPTFRIHAESAYKKITKLLSEG